MPRLTDNAIAAVVRAAGFPQATWATAIAVALAESSGNSDATNHANSNGSSDYGLFQINTVHDDLLQRYKWNDPIDNAKMAYEISSGGTDWTPWVAYTTGRYRVYLPRASKAARNPGLGNEVGPSPNPGFGAAKKYADSSGGILAFVSLMTNPRTWLRVGLALAGMIALWIAYLKMSEMDNVAIKGAVLAVTKGK